MSPWLILFGLVLTYLLTYNTPPLSRFPKEPFQAYRDVRNFDLRVGLVTTVKDPHQLSDWLNYHLAIGFTKIYIIFDDLKDPAISQAQNFPPTQVQVILPNNHWLHNYKPLKSFPKFGPTTQKEAMSRQILNAESVLRRFAPKDHLDWLFHLDCDELLHIPTPQPSSNPPKSPDSTNQTPLHRFAESRKLSSPLHRFAESRKLSSPLHRFLNQFPPRVQVLKLLNLEAAPTIPNAQNCFREHSLFRKRNRGQFRAYHGTKSACRVNNFNHPMSVHFFVTTHPHGVTHTVPETQAQVLHYVNCTYRDWLKKYQTLGKFPDMWWGHRPIKIKFHKESRDQVQRHCPTPDQCPNPKALRKFYQNNMVITDPNTPKNQQNLVKITTPSQILNSYHSS